MIAWYDFARRWPIIGPVLGWLARRSADRALIAANMRRIAALGYTHNAYVQAFDCDPDRCKFCNRDLRMLNAEETRVSPNGEAFEATVRAGYVCVRCCTGTRADHPNHQKHVKIEEYVRP
jgi:hypothetical protein